MNGSGSSRMCAGNFCYASCSQQVTQAGGAAICAQWGGTLVSMSNMTEQSCALQVIAGQEWIGYAQAVSTEPATSWSWTDGQPVGFTSWGATEPNDADGTENGAEQCATMDATGAWYDSPCNEQHGFVCVR